LENMHIVMIEARKSKSFAELRNNCDYSPELLEGTRWYSMNGIAEKYNLIIPAFEKMPAISRVMTYQKIKVILIHRMKLRLQQKNLMSNAFSQRNCKNLDMRRDKLRWFDK
jgi:hypothetical protein